MTNLGFERYRKYAPLLLRVVLGIVFIGHGWGKLTGISGTAGFFGGVNIPLPLFFAWVVAAVEFVGGILVLIGFMTRISSALIAFVMAVAIVQVKLGDGFLGGWEFELSLMAMALALVLTGAGPLSVATARR